MSDTSAHAPPPYASTTAKTSTSSPPKPVPVSQLNAQAHAQAQAQIRAKQTDPSILQPDVNGIAHDRSRPGCLMTCFMLPFPFLCMGCCMSRSSNLDMNETTQTLYLETWPGYLRCCGTGRITIPYSQIANFVAIRANQNTTKRVVVPEYWGALVTRDGTIYKLTEPEYMMDVAPRIIEWQRFVFGRHPHSTWKVPEEDELIYKPAPSS